MSQFTTVLPSGGGYKARPALATETNLPPDLREWVDEATLLVWVEQEVLRLAWQNHLVQKYLTEHPDCRPKAVLSVLVFAYCAAVFDGESVVRLCRTEAPFKALCEGAAPFAHELTTFRRRNRAVIEKVLAGVLLGAVAFRFGLDQRVVPVELDEDLHERACERLDIARHMDVVDA